MKRCNLFQDCRLSSVYLCRCTGGDGLGAEDMTVNSSQFIYLSLVSDLVSGLVNGEKLGVIRDAF